MHNILCNRSMEQVAKYRPVDKFSHHTSPGGRFDMSEGLTFYLERVVEFCNYGWFPLKWKIATLAKHKTEHRNIFKVPRILVIQFILNKLQTQFVPNNTSNSHPDYNFEKNVLCIYHNIDYDILIQSMWGFCLHFHKPYERHSPVMSSFHYTYLVVYFVSIDRNFDNYWP